MTIISLPNGIGATTGDSLALVKPLTVNGNVWYVDSVTGTDAASPAGKNRSKPLATLAQAQTNAANGDIVSILPTHTETLTSTLALSKDLTLVGEGSDSGNPTAQFNTNHATNDLFSITATGLFQIRGLLFPEAAQTNTGNKISAIGATPLLRIVGCRFEQGALDKGSACTIGHGGDFHLKSTTFVSTALTTAIQPTAAIDTFNGANINFVWDGVVLDGGTVGWANPFAVDMTSSTTTNLIAESISLLNGSLMRVSEATLGYINIQTSTGGARVDWCDI